MPYTHTTFGDLKNKLATRLFDTQKVFWVDEELGMLLTEALRTFGLCSGFWRERGTLTTTPNQAFYSLTDSLVGTKNQKIMAETVTDRDIIRRLFYHLLEDVTDGSTYDGTEMFTYQDLFNAVQHRLNQFIADTGLNVNRTVIDVASPPIGREQLDQNTVDVRRAAWIGTT